MTTRLIPRLMSRSVILVVICSCFVVACQVTQKPNSSTEPTNSKKTTPSPKPVNSVLRETLTATPTLQAQPSKQSVNLPSTPTPYRLTENPTQSSSAMIIARVNINIRSGPGRVYLVVGNLFANDKAIILGRTEDTSWWKIQCPTNINSVECWVTAGERYTVAQNMSDVSVVEPPPTPIITTALQFTKTPKPQRREKPEQPCSGYDCPPSSVMLEGSLSDNLEVAWLGFGLVATWIWALTKWPPRLGKNRKEE